MQISITTKEYQIIIYVDESIQDGLGYICIGFAYCEEAPDDFVSNALLKAGLVPGADEYKSGTRMEKSAHLIALREHISEIVLQHCQLGVYIGSTAERPNLINAVAETARKIVCNNRLPTPQMVFVDEGFGGNLSTSLDGTIDLVRNCDSRIVFGIQLADYVAYHTSYLLKCTLENKVKIVRMEMPPHPKYEEEVELDWVMRTELRRNFFVEDRDIESITGDDWFFKVDGYGAFYSSHLSPSIEMAARKTFDSMYWGCVW